MSGNRRDVNLVIRAKDEASRAFESATAVLEQLVGINARVGTSAQSAGSDLAKLGEIALTLDRVFGQVNTAADKAAAGFARQQAAIAAQRTELASYSAQAKAAAAVIERLNSAEAVVAAGRNQGPRLAQLAEATREYERLIQVTDRLKVSISIADAELNGQQSSLQKVGSTAIAVERARESLAGAIERETRAMREQARAASTVAAIEQSTGITRDRTEYELLTAQIRQTAEARDLEITKLRAEEAATTELSRAKQNQININKLLGVGTSTKSARDSASVFQEADVKINKDFEQSARDAAQAAREEDAAIASLRAHLDPLAVAEAKAAVELRRLSDWHKRGKISTQEHDAAVRVLKTDLDRLRNSFKGIDSRGRPSIFGLKPYEAQNFAFQINDIITQLASGTSLSQTLAQQSGQLIQLFPKVGSAIISAFKSGPILAFVATIGVLVTAMMHAADQAERLRTFEGILTANADGARHSAAALVDATKALDLYGLTAEQALSVVRTLLAEGFDDSRIVQLGLASKDLADILGIDVKDAAKQVSDAFNGSYDAIKKLDEATNFLTAEQRDHIKTLFLEGKAQEARTLALNIFSGKMEDAATKMRGSWSEATRSLGNAWSSFVAAIAETGAIDHMGDALDKLARKTNNLINKLRGVRDLSNVDSDIKDIEDRVAARSRGRIGIFAEGAIDFFSGSNAKQDEEELNRLLQERQRILTGLTNEQSANAGRTRELSELQKKQNSDLAAATRQLRAQGDLLTDQQKLQLTYNDALLEAQRLFPNSSAELQKQYALTKQKIEQVRLSKAAAAEAERAANAAERERRERERQARDPAFQAAKLLKEFEGFTSRAKFDVNAFRVGFGSDTVTRADGSVQRVTANTRTTLEDATRDLTRRIEEFQKVIKEQIGSDRFASFGAEQQAALTSIAYNYGRLPDRIIEAVRSGTSDDIAAAVRGLAGDNAGVNSRRRNREADILGRPNLAVEADTQRQLDDIKKKQDEYITKIREGVDARELENEFLVRQKGLTGDALVEEQKRQFVVQETLKAQAEADKLDIARDDPEWVALIARIKDAAAAYFDLAHAKERASLATESVEKPIGNLTAQRDAIQQQIEFLRENGLVAQANGLLPVLDQVNGKLREAIDKAIEFYKALDPETDPLGRTREEIDAIILGLNNAKLASHQWGQVLGISAQQIAQAFTSSVVGAFNKFTQAVAEGQNVFGALKDSFLDFASNFLRMIADMIIQMLAFQAVVMIMKALGVPVPGSAPVAHRGGVIGKTALPRRAVSPLWFGAAMRYHTGGIAGLKPNEVPAILERGEEVLTEADPRHRANGGGVGAPVNLKVVNAIDAGDFVSQGIGTKTGERAVLNWMRANAGAVKQALGG